ncbi:Uncharacterised protein [uncultured Blautia sp.]|nr:Uncharacterised protein [uncultured Blautia sp.]
MYFEKITCRFQHGKTAIQKIETRKAIDGNSIHTFVGGESLYIGRDNHHTVSPRSQLFGQVVSISFHAAQMREILSGKNAVRLIHSSIPIFYICQLKNISVR